MNTEVAPRQRRLDVIDKQRGLVLQDGRPAVHEPRLVVPEQDLIFAHTPRTFFRELWDINGFAPKAQFDRRLVVASEVDDSLITITGKNTRHASNLSLRSREVLQFSTEVHEVRIGEEQLTLVTAIIPNRFGPTPLTEITHGTTTLNSFAYEGNKDEYRKKFEEVLVDLTTHLDNAEILEHNDNPLK